MNTHQDIAVDKDGHIALRCASRWGLANMPVPRDRVRAEATKLAQEIAGRSPLGLLSTRATMRGDLVDRVLAAPESGAWTWKHPAGRHRQRITRLNRTRQRDPIA